MTRISNNRQCTHEFFYCNHSTANEDYTFGTQCSFGKNFSDDDNNLLNFYSYYTKVAMLYHSDKTNETYLLINWSSMTATTGKHLSYLRQANPYYTVIEVPFTYGQHTTSLREIKNNLIKNIQYYYDNKDLLYKKDNRDFFNEIKKSFTDIDYYIGLDADDMQYIDMINDIDDFINNDNFIQRKKELAKQKAAKTRQENKEKQARIEQQKQELTTNYSYLELIKKANDWSIDYELRQFIKDYILLSNKYAYCWFEGDSVKTSKHVTVNKSDVITLLKLWKHNKLKHGQTIDRYTVLEVMPDYVKIGCHVIPTTNIQALYDEYQKELTTKEVA